MHRGEVYELRAARAVGHEHTGRRLGVVVQADVFLLRSVVLVAPTSRSARAASFRPEIEVDGESTRVLVEHTGTIDVSRLGSMISVVTAEEQWGIDDALALVLGLG